MPWNEVPAKWKAGKLHSGSKHGPVIKDQKQMVAVMLSEKRKAQGGKKEYQALKGLKDAKPKEKS
jgi:hypothetical protein